MRKIVLLLFLCPLAAPSQNVGIGTANPVAKLEVKNSVRNTVRISTSGFSDTAELLISNRDNLNQGTDFSLKSIREEGLFFSSLSDLPANNSTTSMVIRPNGNVGVGILPAFKFHVNGASRFNGLFQLEGLNLFEFGAGVPGKEINAGKIGYNAFGQNALTFIGAGTNVTNRAVFFFAEGGSTFNGPLNIGGALQLNGNPGTAGQVLRSNGAALPQWENAALDNNTRFSVLFSSTVEGSGSINITSTQYNLNPGDIAIGASTITINKTGLYHINAQVTSRVLTAAPTSYVPEVSTLVTLTSGATVVNTLRMAYLAHYDESNSDAGGNGSYYYTKMVEGDIYLTAGMTIRVNRDLRVEGIPTDVIFDVQVIGHLVAE